jgi:hypothetical protein
LTIIAVLDEFLQLLPARVLQQLRAWGEINTYISFFEKKIKKISHFEPGEKF